jgi:ABC-type transport system involved in cytochrome c biogenesis permease subunit
MCLPQRNLPFKARLLLTLGILFAGITMSRINGGHSDWSHFLSGFLLGLAITFLFATAYSARCNPSRQS